MNCYFAASPFVKSDKYIKFEKEIKYDSELEKFISNKENEFENAIINNTNKSILDLKKIKKINKVEVVNVGQGNFVLGKKNNKISTIFDIGFTKDEGHLPTYNKAISIYRNIKRFSGPIVISHLDIDHILGAIYLDDYVLHNAAFIIGYVNGIKEHAKNLLRYLLSKNKNVYLLNQFEEIINISNIEFIQGKCKSSDINNNSLVCKITGRKRAVLIPGDAMYGYFSHNDNFVSSEIIILPHHGQDYKYKKDSFNLKSKIGFVCCGKNFFGHPRESHLKMFKHIYRFDNDCPKGEMYISKNKSIGDELSNFVQGDTFSFNLNKKRVFLKKDLCKIKK